MRQGLWTPRPMINSVFLLESPRIGGIKVQVWLVSFTDRHDAQRPCRHSLVLRRPKLFAVVCAVSQWHVEMIIRNPQITVLKTMSYIVYFYSWLNLISKSFPFLLVLKRFLSILSTFPLQ
jgi:hypothetical protein